MAKLVKGCSIVAVRRVEAVLRRQTDFVCTQAVERPVVLIVFDNRPGVLEDGFGLFVRVPGRGEYGCIQGRDVAIQLVYMKDRGEAHNRPGPVQSCS